MKKEEILLKDKVLKRLQDHFSDRYPELVIETSNNMPGMIADFTLNTPPAIIVTISTHPDMSNINRQTKGWPRMSEVKIVDVDSDGVPKLSRLDVAYDCILYQMYAGWGLDRIVGLYILKYLA